MKYLSLCLLLTAVCMFLACGDDDFSPQNEYDWIKIVVPEASTIYSFSGNIENELIVGGLGEIRKTTNQGETWYVVHDNITAYELRNKQDTLFAIALYNPTYHDYFSLDNSDTWQLYAHKSLENLRTSTLISSNGTIYKIVDSGTFPKQPDQVLKSSDGGLTWEDIFPYKHSIYSIYLDDDDRLYLGVSGGREWNESNNSFDSNSEDTSGIIYYLKD